MNRSGTGRPGGVVGQQRPVRPSSNVGYIGASSTGNFSNSGSYSGRSRTITAILVILGALTIGFAIVAIGLTIKLATSPDNNQPGGSPPSRAILVEDDDDDGDDDNINNNAYLDNGIIPQTMPPRINNNGQKIALLGPERGSIVMTCGNQACLDLAMTLYKTVNKSADPCVHFYDHVCGNWPARDTTSANSLFDQLVHSIDSDVQSLLENILSLPSLERTNGRSHAESQVVDFYDACTNVTTRERLRGKPLTSLLESALRPANLFGGADLELWNPISAWKRTLREYGVEILFSIHVQVPPETEGAIWVVIAPRSPQLASLMDSSEGAQRARDVLVDLGRKLSQTAGIIPASYDARGGAGEVDQGSSSAAINDFAADAVEFSQMLVDAARSGTTFRLISMTPQEFVDYFNGNNANVASAIFNPVEYFSDFFTMATHQPSAADSNGGGGYPANSRTVPIKVDAGIERYILAIEEYRRIHPETWKRRLNNYMATEIALHYLLELSGDYERHLATFFPKSYNRFYSKSYTVESRCRSEAEFTFKDTLYHMLLLKSKSARVQWKPPDLLVRLARDLFVTSVQSSQILNQAQIRLLSVKVLTARVVNQTARSSLDEQYSSIRLNRMTHFDNVVAVQRLRFERTLRLLVGRESAADRWDNFLRSASFAAYAGDYEKAFYINMLMFRQPLFDAEWPAEFNLARSASIYYHLLKSMMLPYLEKETNSSLFRSYRATIGCYHDYLLRRNPRATIADAANFAVFYNAINSSMWFTNSYAAQRKQAESRKPLDYALPGFLIKPRQLGFILAAQPFCRKVIADSQRDVVSWTFQAVSGFTEAFASTTPSCSAVSATSKINCPQIP